MRKINLFPLFIACILSACLSPSEGDDFPNEPPKLNPTSSLTTVFTATPSQTPTPEPTPTPDPAQIAAEDLSGLKLNPADFNITINTDGQVEAIGKSSTEFEDIVVLRGDTWNAQIISKIAAKSCYPTPFERQPGTNTSKNLKEDFYKYLRELRVFVSKQFLFNEIDSAGLPEFLPNTDNCWGEFVAKVQRTDYSVPAIVTDFTQFLFFVWEKSKGAFEVVKVFHT